MSDVLQNVILLSFVLWDLHEKIVNVYNTKWKRVTGNMPISIENEA